MREEGRERDNDEIGRKERKGGRGEGKKVMREREGEEQHRKREWGGEGREVEGEIAMRRGERASEERGESE